MALEGDLQLLPNQQEVGANRAYPPNQREAPTVAQLECLHNHLEEATDLRVIMVLQVLPYRTPPVTGAVADSAGAVEEVEAEEGVKSTATAHWKHSCP